MTSANVGVEAERIDRLEVSGSRVNLFAVRIDAVSVSGHDNGITWTAGAGHADDTGKDNALAGPDA